MKTLVLCIDRDNDIGVKAGIKSPVIGRAQNLKAAMALALRDPEDSDTNAIFAAISIYDDLVKKDHDVEIATIAGDIDVGHVSDQLLTEQLDTVIKETKPQRAYLISDGAEDAQIYPIVSSRITVNHVKRVFIKQDKSIESTYYMLVKTFQDEKFRRKIFTPLGLMFAIGALGWLATILLQWLYPNVTFVRFLPGLTVAAVLLLLGAYFLNHAYRIGETLGEGFDSLKDAVVTAKVSFFSIIIAIVLIIVGTYISYGQALPPVPPLERPLVFMESLVMFLGIAGWTYVAGHAIDYYIRRSRMERSFAVKTMSVIAITLILYAILAAIRLFTIPTTDDPTRQYMIIAGWTIAGSIFIGAGAGLNHWLKGESDREARWRH